MKAELESGGRILLGGRAVADYVALCWSLGFNWTPLYIHIQFSIYIVSIYM